MDSLGGPHAVEKRLYLGGLQHTLISFDEIFDVLWDSDKLPRQRESLAWEVGGTLANNWHDVSDVVSVIGQRSAG